MGNKTRSGLHPRPGPQRRAKAVGSAIQDPEFWQPRDEFAPGRPRVYVKRTMETDPPPTPQDTDCVLWCGAVDRYGYGVLSANNRRVRAHRWMYEMHNSPILPGLVVRHKCDNRVCINLDHLGVGDAGGECGAMRRRGIISVRCVRCHLVRCVR